MATNNIFYPLDLRIGSSGSPSLGIGVGVNFIVETSNGNFETGAVLDIVTTDVTSTSEDFDWVFKSMLNGASSDEKFRITSDGRLYGKFLHNNGGSLTGTTNQYIASGTFTPTISNTANISTNTARTAQWIRVGNVVTFSGNVSISTTSTSISANFDISLPITSSFSTIYQAGGAGGMYNNTPIQVRSNNGSNTALVVFISNSTSTSDLSYTIQYEIV